MVPARWQENVVAYRPDTPEKVAKYRELLKDNLTTPMKMEVLIADADGSNAKTN